MAPIPPTDRKAAIPPLTARDAPVVVTNTATIPQRASRLPGKLRFPIFVALSFILQNTAWSGYSNVFPPELGFITKVDLDDTAGMTARLGFRIGLLYTIWKAGYDYIDAAALTVLATTPYAYLVTTYYNISRMTLAAYVGIEVLSIAFPLLLLRPRSKVHNSSVALRNRFLLESTQVQTTATLLAIGVYVTVLLISVKSGVLNSFIVSHFDVPTVERAYNETVPSIITKVAFAGIAAKAFLLNPSIGEQTAPSVVSPVHAFDPITATLPATIEHNFWNFSKRTKTLIKRTAILSVFMFANAAQRTATLRESDWTGAAGYALLWVVATLITSAWWVWVGDAEA